MLEFAAIWLTAYLIGGIPFGYLVARARGVNILAQGSGNIGATNVGRVLGFRFGVLVFVLDFAKGALPVVGAWLLQRNYPITAGDWLREDWLRNGLVEVGAGLLAFLGHLLPVYLGFRGGKGVATGAGVVAVLVPWPALAAFGIWILLTAATRYISLASIGAVLTLCAFQLAMTSCDGNNPRTWFCVLGAGLVLVRHRANLARLLKGTENRLPPSAKLVRLAAALHVLALALWFGGSVFFTFVVTPLVFSNFESLTDLPAAERPGWLPLPAVYAKVDKNVNVIGPKVQGIRLAGSVVGGIFPVYFLVQIACGIVALIPTLAWWHSSPGDKTRWLRCCVLLMGLLLALAGVGLQHKVHDLQGPYHHAVEEYLKNPTADSPTDPAVQELQAVRKRFGMWHGISVLTNYATMLMVTAAMILTVALPGGREAASDVVLPSRPEG